MNERKSSISYSVAKAWLLWACESEYIILTCTHAYTQRIGHAHIDTHAHPYERARTFLAISHQYNRTNSNPLHECGCLQNCRCALPIARYVDVCERSVSEWECVSEKFLVHRKWYAGGDKRYGFRRDGTLCSSIDRHTVCYILCEHFALEIILLYYYVLMHKQRQKKRNWRRKIRICV